MVQSIPSPSSALPNSQQAILLAALAQANQTNQPSSPMGGPSSSQPSFNMPPTATDQFSSLGIPAPGQGGQPSSPPPSMDPSMMMMASPPSPEQPQQPSAMPPLPAPASASLGSPSQDPGMMAPPPPGASGGFKLPYLRSLSKHATLGQTVVNPITSGAAVGVISGIGALAINTAIESIKQTRFVIPEGKWLLAGIPIISAILAGAGEFYHTNKLNAKYGPLLPVLGPQTPKGQADQFMAGQSAPSSTAPGQAPTA